MGKRVLNKDLDEKLDTIIDLLKNIKETSDVLGWISLYFALWGIALALIIGGISLSARNFEIAGYILYAIAMIIILYVIFIKLKKYKNIGEVKMNKKGFKEYDREFIDGIIFGILLSILGNFAVSAYMKITNFSDDMYLGMFISSFIAVIVIIVIIMWKKKKY
jgi:hypothetical protein